MDQAPIAHRAVVVGAGIAGLLAARVLADHYEEVTVLDRDQLPHDDRARRGAPQGTHAHALLARGQQLLEARFPGLTAELAAAGATVGDALGDVRMHVSGHRLCSTDTGLVAISASRGFIEHHLRRRVEAMNGVSFSDRCDVLGITLVEDTRTVTGVRVLRRSDGSAEERIIGEVVVDASGRLSRVPAWLEAAGITPPEESRVEVDLGYASRRYRLDRRHLDGDIAVIHGMTPDRPRAGVAAALENGTGIITLAGIGDDRPPTDPAGFDRFASTVGELGHIAGRVEPLDMPVPFRFPASIRRRVDGATCWPDGLVSLGDSFCSVNPIYGQGMTLAALAAEALDAHLHRYRRVRPKQLHRAIAATVDPAWQMVTGADLALPPVPGHPTPPQRLLGRYVRRLHTAAASDPILATEFARVAGLVDRPQALLRPSVVRRVLLGS
jgi:2-polyprenyl-6-methoxyphenol hydroxylase-like FAD-dependent oxidoreductase